jgi:hypothetical protein
VMERCPWSCGCRCERSLSAYPLPRDGASLQRHALEGTLATPHYIRVFYR